MAWVANRSTTVRNAVRAMRTVRSGAPRDPWAARPCGAISSRVVDIASASRAIGGRRSAAPVADGRRTVDGGWGRTPSHHVLVHALVGGREEIRREQDHGPAPGVLPPMRRGVR